MKNTFSAYLKEIELEYKTAFGSLKGFTSEIGQKLKWWIPGDKNKLEEFLRRTPDKSPTSVGGNYWAWLEGFKRKLEHQAFRCVKVETTTNAVMINNMSEIYKYICGASEGAPLQSLLKYGAHVIGSGTLRVCERKNLDRGAG